MTKKIGTVKSTLQFHNVGAFTRSMPVKLML